MRTRSLLLAVIAIGGCGKDEAKASDRAVAGSAAPAPPASDTVAIFVDDAPVGTLAPAQLASWPRLDTLVPTSARRLGMWQDVFLAAKDPKPVQVHSPASTYPDLVPAMFPGEGGGAAFGMFDPVELSKHGKPALRQDGVREVRVKLAQNSGRGEHDDGNNVGGDPTQLKISVKTLKGEQIIDGAKLLAIPRSPMPGDTGTDPKGNDPKGWPLTALLDAAGVKTFQKLLLTDATGTNLTLEKADFDPKVSVPFIKLNRQGALRFRVYTKVGDGWQSKGDLRGLVAIEVLK